MVEHTICSTCQADISGVAGQHLDETMHADITRAGEKSKQEQKRIQLIIQNKGITNRL